MNEKLTVLAVNGESYDIWDENAVKVYKFPDFHSAVAAVNSDIFTGEKPAVEAVSVIRYGPGSYRVDLLTDLTETGMVEITTNVDLHLNGKTLIFDIPENANYAITIANDVVFTIDGQVAGSTIRRIVETGDTAGVARYGINMSGKELILRGGSYEMELHSEATQVSGVIAFRTGSLRADGSTFVISGPVSATRYGVTADSDGSCVLTDCKFQVTHTAEAEFAIALMVRGGKYELNECEMILSGEGIDRYGIYAIDSNIKLKGSTISTSGQTSGGTGVRITGGTASISDTNISTDGQTSGGDGIYCLNGKLKLENVDIHTNGLTACGIGLVAHNSMMEACDTRAVCNGPINGGVGIYLNSTTAFMTNCYANAGHTGIQVNPGSNLYFRDGLIRGFTHSLYCIHSPENQCYIKDSTLECRNNEDIPLCIDTPNVHKCCCYIGLYENVGQTTHFDGCTFKSGNDEMSIDEAVVLRAKDAQETETAACMSNCVILLSDPTPFRLEAGKSAVNIGVNTVDGSGNPITQAKVHPGTGGVDSVPGNLHVTGLLYRKLADTECCTGKDMQAFYDYYGAVM